MWRWSHLYPCHSEPKKVFSTYVEVILALIIELFKLTSILHVCGGDPKTYSNPKFEAEYSPRMWRWSHASKRHWARCLVFSTYVEVILVYVHLDPKFSGILHVCGGDPSLANLLLMITRYSPRMWRWSPRLERNQWVEWVFSTYVEVIL